MIDQLAPLLPSLLAASLTMMVFSYLIGDNPLYRIAVHLFVGVATAYATTVAVQSVIAPRSLAVMDAVSGLLAGDWQPFTLQLIPWVLGVFIFLRVFPRLAPMGNFALAFMVGVGAALTVGGAITGTIFSQVQASWSPPESGFFGLLKLLIALAASAAVLLYFFFTGQSKPDGRGERFRLMLPAAWAGQGAMMVALAAFYTGAVAASFALFIERIQFLIATTQALLKAAGFGT
ncbi:MAG: hypothetical protein FJ030_01730 [Chloroflexi bacterium]|nr:hypothetical protein [Chloroflexota bacterium]